MATVNNPQHQPLGVAELHTGDRMTQAEFHGIDQRMPAGFRAELIGGTAYVASPLKRQHGSNHLPLGSLMDVLRQGAGVAGACCVRRGACGAAEVIGQD